MLQVPPNCEAVDRVLEGWSDRLKRAGAIRQNETVLQVSEHRWNAVGAIIGDMDTVSEVAQLLF